jgi:hypothetical protein
MVTGVIMVRARSMGMVRSMGMKCSRGTAFIAIAEPASPRVDERLQGFLKVVLLSKTTFKKPWNRTVSYRRTGYNVISNREIMH